MKELFVPTHPPTLVAEGTSIQGGIVFQSSADVFGTVEGDIYQQTLEPLYVGKNAWVRGSIHSVGPVRIDGRVDGDIFCATRVHLSRSAKVQGRLKCSIIQVNPGAHFEGQFEMEGAESERRLSPQRAA